MKTGEKITKSRKDVNLTQDQLAQLMGVTRQTISKWETDSALPETAKLVRLAETLNVSCDYLLKNDQPKTTEITMKSENSYVIDWTKLYPVLSEYPKAVDCDEYHRIFSKMIKDMMKAYNYSLEDTVSVLKDLQYKVFLQMQEEETKTDEKS